ncbi:hypothetical protein CCP4SC76_3460001 [Gammaproteobacteria bacterium]
MQTDTRRYQFKHKPRVIDMGLRLADIEAMDLDSETVEYRGDEDPRPGLIQHGATAEEANYLATGKQEGRWVGKRVELNAMTSSQFITWLEAKLEESGVEKFVPDAEVLKTAWKKQWRIEQLNKALEEIEKTVCEGPAPEPPENLAEQVAARLVTHRTRAWDSVLMDGKMEGEV